MKDKPYKYDFKYRIEETKNGWCIKKRGAFGFWRMIKDGIENEKVAYFIIEQAETPNKDAITQ